MPQRRPSWNSARLFTTGGSPFSPFAGFPPFVGGAIGSPPPVLPLLDEPPELDEDEDDEGSAEPSGSGVLACFGSVGWQAARRRMATETARHPRFMALNGNTRPHPSPTGDSAGNG